MMKKGLLIAVIVVVGLTNLNAQDVSFGVKAGVNFPNLYGKGLDKNISKPQDLKMLTGWHVGGFLEFMLTENFGGQVEIVFLNQQAEYQNTEYELRYTSYNEWGYPDYVEKIEKTTHYSYNLNSINIPLLAKFYPFNNFNVHAGPQVDFLLSPKEDGFKSTALGVSGGIGYELDMGLFLSARYYNGFTNLVDYSESYTYNLSSFQFSLGYKF